MCVKVIPKMTLLRCFVNDVDIPRVWSGINMQIIFTFYSLNDGNSGHVAN